MISVLISVFCAVAAISFACGGNWGPAAVAVFISVSVLGLHVCDVEDSKARINRRDYWAMSGTERAKAERCWAEEAGRQAQRELRRRELCEKRAVDRIWRQAGFNPTAYQKEKPWKPVRETYRSEVLKARYAPIKTTTDLRTDLERRRARERG